MFEVGQRVVCIKTHSQGIIKEGEIFTISAIKEFECGCVVVDLGIKSDRINGNCGMHGTIYYNGGTHWISTKIIRPIDETFADEVLENILTQIKEEELLEI